MFEVKFNKKTNIEKNIKNSKVNDNLVKIYSRIIITFCLLSGLIIAGTLGINLINSSTVAKNIFKLLGIVTLCFGSYSAGKIFNYMISTAKAIKANKNLKNLAETLTNNKIKTNGNELANSVIIKNTKKSTLKENNDSVITSRKKVTEEKYYLFLDDNSEIQGLLEVEEITKINDKKTKDMHYYVLEEPEIKQLEPKVTKVKKLVRTKDINNKL